MIAESPIDLGGRSNLPLVTVELINRDSPWIKHVIQSIAAQTYKDWELVIVDSSSRDWSTPPVGQHRVRVVRKNLSSLAARMEAHSESEGEFSLVLDSTRILSPDCLDLCLKICSNFDMLAIAEGSLGTSVVAKLFALDRKAIQKQVQGGLLIDPGLGYVLPRFFRRELLDTGVLNLNSRLGPERLSRMIGADLGLLFAEAWKLSHKLGYVDREALTHFEDSSLSEVWKKYYRYGRSWKPLMALPEYRWLFSPQQAQRPLHGLSAREQIGVLATRMLRGVPFATGYYL